MTRLDTWASVVAALDMEQQDLLQGLAQGKSVAELARRGGRDEASVCAVLGSAFTYVGQRLRRQAGQTHEHRRGYQRRPD